jgi:hypothetical protein
MISGVSTDYTPFDPQPRRQPLLERVRDLWTLHGIQSNVTAAIWRNDFGLELFRTRSLRCATPGHRL